MEVGIRTRSTLLLLCSQGGTHPGSQHSGGASLLHSTRCAHGGLWTEQNRGLTPSWYLSSTRRGDPLSQHLSFLKPHQGDARPPELTGASKLLLPLCAQHFPATRQLQTRPPVLHCLTWAGGHLRCCSPADDAPLGRPVVSGPSSAEETAAMVTGQAAQPPRGACSPGPRTHGKLGRLSHKGLPPTVRPCLRPGSGLFG